MDILQGLEAFFATVPLGAGDRIVVAFSGGGDSTALLWGLQRQARRWGIDLLAAHLDHGMDPASAARQAQAAGIARQLGVPLVSERREVGRHRRSGESLEVAARRLRYEFLERIRGAARARYVATAHHREDQAETVLLRLAYGSGLRGLAGIRPAAGTLLRPLLALPRAALRAAVTRAGLTPAEDPGNADPRQPRSRMRHRVLPALAAAEAARAGTVARRREDLEDLVVTLARLADRVARAGDALDRRLALAIGLPVAAAGAGRPAGRTDAAAIADRGAAADSRRLRALPAALLPHALALLHRRAGAAYPASRAAHDEIGRQLRRPRLPPPLSTRSPRSNIACDCGRGWRWLLGDDGTLRLRRAPAAATDPAAAVPFTYTLEVPGALTIPEIAVTITVSETPVEPWMWHGEPRRAALAVPAGQAAGAGWTVRNRRSGDRLRPLGSPGSRKLKEILIDRGVPRWQRDRLPLLCWAGEIAWVPGVTIDHRFRLAGRSPVWVAEISPAAASELR